MWSSYSAKAAAQLIGLPESAVRTLIRAGVVGAQDDVPARLSFRDLASLRVVKSLVDAGLALANVRRDVVAIRRVHGGGDKALTELPLEARAGRVCLRGQPGPGGQMELPFDVAPRAEPEVQPLPTRGRLAPLNAPLPQTAEEWFARAVELEESSVESAAEAYRHVLRLRPDATEAWVNLGRLYAENGQGGQAAECFRAALAVNADDATAVYNLGVVAQDTGQEVDAIMFYERSLELDPSLAEAHYNLASLFDHRGDSQAAIRHIHAYRRLTK